jgi:hypothetical protein
MVNPFFHPNKITSLMEETREQQKLHGFLQCAIYISIGLEAAIFIYHDAPFWGIFFTPLDKISHLVIYSGLVYSKLTTFGLICLVSIGTLAKKKTDLDPKKHIIYPLATGLFLFFGSLVFALPDLLLCRGAYGEPVDGQYFQIHQIRIRQG